MGFEAEVQKLAAKFDRLVSKLKEHGIHFIDEVEAIPSEVEHEAEKIVGDGAKDVAKAADAVVSDVKPE